MYGLPLKTSGAWKNRKISTIIQLCGNAVTTCHIIWRANYGVCITRIFITDGSINRSTFDCRAVNNLIIFDFVQLKKKNVTRQYSRFQTEAHFDFERFNALRVQGSSCQAEIRKLNMASPVHQKILRDRQ